MPTQEKNRDELPTASLQNIKVLELRNYLMRAGRRDEFINYFEDNFLQSQRVLGGYVLGQYTVKNAADNFFWMRGFKDMKTRSSFLNEFYYGPFWRAHKALPNSLLLNNDNVYLLKPLNLTDTSALDNGFDMTWFAQRKGIAVIDFYISNTKRDGLIDFVRKQYSSLLQASGIKNTSFWISESTPNDFIALPVFQDKNLLVQITFYKDEIEYQTKQQLLVSKLDEKQVVDMADLVTIKHSMIVYPTNRSY